MLTTEGKEVVVRRRGADWSFHLPEHHTIEFTADKLYVVLATPDTSSLYRVARIDDADPEEIVVFLGEESGKAGPPGWGHVPEAVGYPLPEIQDEFARLKSRWVDAGLRETDFNAWPQGDPPHEVQLRRLRGVLRERSA